MLLFELLLYCSKRMLQRRSYHPSLWIVNYTRARAHTHTHTHIGAEEAYGVQGMLQRLKQQATRFMSRASKGLTPACINDANSSKNAALALL